MCKFITPKQSNRKADKEVIIVKYVEKFNLDSKYSMEF